MTIDPFIFFVLVAINLVFGFLLLALIVAYSKIVAALKKEKDEHMNSKTNYEAQAVELLEEARKKALVLVEEGEKKSQEILANMQSFDKTISQSSMEDIRQLVESQKKELHALSSTLISGYQQVINQEKQEDIKIIQNTTKEIENQAMHEVSSFASNLQHHTIESEKQLQHAMEEQYQQLKKELEEYKKNEIAHIKESFYPFLEDIATDVLGKSFSIKDHEDIVIEAVKKIGVKR